MVHRHDRPNALRTIGVANVLLAASRVSNSTLSAIGNHERVKKMNVKVGTIHRNEKYGYGVITRVLENQSMHHETFVEVEHIDWAKGEIVSLVYDLELFQPLEVANGKRPSKTR